MSLISNISWIASNVDHKSICGKRVLDVGSRQWDDIDGNPELTIRDFILGNKPDVFIGVDKLLGNQVDFRCDVTELVERFGQDSFDSVFCVEVLEHVEDYRSAIHNLKSIVSIGGTLCLTTRTPGYPVHGYPEDYWRFDEKSILLLLSGFETQAIKEDTENNGIYYVGKKVELCPTPALSIPKP